MKPANTHVTGVLVTGKHTDRFAMARRAVKSWQLQEYDGPRQLLVINDHPTESLYDPAAAPAGVLEVRMEERHSLGRLRNIGIAAAPAESVYMVQWDDDDFSAPSRLQYQVESTKSGQASIFRYEINYDLLTGNAFVNNGRAIRGGGFPGTMLWPLSTKARFPDKGKAEDTEFVLALRSELSVQVLRNDPRLYTRTYHGLNTWSQKHVMKRKPGSRDLSDHERLYLESLRQEGYFAILPTAKEPS